MAGMDAAQMASMRPGLAGGETFIAADVALCPALPAGEVSEFAIGADRDFESRQLLEERVSSAAPAWVHPSGPRSAEGPPSQVPETYSSQHLPLGCLPVPLRI